MSGIPERSAEVLSNDELYRPVLCLTRKWNRIASDFIKRQSTNPFSGRYCGKLKTSYK